MSKEKVKLILVVDASGSMHATKAETVQAVQDLIDEHRTLTDKKVRVQIFTFDSTVNELVPLTKLKEYNSLFADLYQTNGLTALYDGIGKAITTNIDDKSYAKTSLVILTDGAENSSQEFNKATVAKLITEVQDDLGWDVTYLGAKMANFEEYTTSLGFKSGKSVAFDPNLGGTRGASLSTASTMSMAYLSAKD